MLLLMLCSLNY